MYMMDTRVVGVDVQLVFLDRVIPCGFIAALWTQNDEAHKADLRHWS
jgi:hypothetical protein